MRPRPSPRTPRWQGRAAQALRLSCLYHTPCDRVAAVIPSAERWMPFSEGFLQSVTGDTAMQNKYAEVTPRNFNPMWAPGLSDEARKAVNAAFDAMSTWRIETAKNSEKNSEQVIEKLAAAARALG